MIATCGRAESVAGILMPRSAESNLSRVCICSLDRPARRTRPWSHRDGERPLEPECDAGQSVTCVTQTALAPRPCRYSKQGTTGDKRGEPEEVENPGLRSTRERPRAGSVHVRMADVFARQRGGE